MKTESAMEVELCCDAIVSTVDAALDRIKWRMRYASKRRLHTDILALLTRLRPIIMLDYGGKMPELLLRIGALVELLRKEFPGFEHLRVVLIEDMIYIVHVREFAEFLRSSLNLELPYVFCDIGQEPIKIVSQGEDNSTLIQLKSLQNSFAEFFPIGGELGNSISQPCNGTNISTDGDVPSNSMLDNSQSPQFIDLSSFLQETEVTIPTLNGWLLGYPMIYLFDKSQIADATYNLSTKFLHVYKVFLRRPHCNPDQNGDQQEELLSFSAPWELSTSGGNEQWAKEFLALMETKVIRCGSTWKSLHMEVSEFNPQAIAF